PRASCETRALRFGRRYSSPSLQPCGPDQRPARGTPCPCRLIQACEAPGTSIPPGPASRPPGEADRRRYPKAISLRVHPKQRASFAAKLIVSGSQLAKFFKHNPPKLAPRRRKIVRHVGCRELEVSRERLIAW